jgi:hypothetical protein
MSASATKSAAPKLGSVTPIQFAGDLSGNYSTQNVLKWRNKSLDATTMGAPTDAQIPIYVNGSSAWKSVTMSGDVTLSNAGVATVASSAKGITQLTGEVTAGPGSGSQASVVTGPFSQSALAWGAGVSAASLGTNKAGATLSLQADVGANVMRLAGGTQNGFALGANPATVGHLRSPNNFVWMARDASNGSDLAVVTLNSSNEFIFGDLASQASYIETNCLASGAICLAAAGGWGLEWTSGQLLSVNGGLTIGTQLGASYMTTIVSGSGATNVVASATGGVGTGTTTINGALKVTTRTITGNLTIDTTTTDNIVVVDTSSGVVSVTLPTPTNGREIELIDKKSTWGTNVLTLVRNGSEKIDNVAASRVVSTSGARCKVWSDGTDWYTGC